MSAPRVSSCFRCGDSIAKHGRGGGACQAADEDGVCPCPGFLHVEVARRQRQLRAREEAAALWRR